MFDLTDFIDKNNSVQICLSLHFLKPCYLVQLNIPNGHLLMSKTLPPANKCSKYDTKQSDGEAPVLELWGM